jgi:hypothetical protein
MAREISSRTLEEAWLKLRRGKEHLYMLEMETRKFWDSDSHAVVYEYNVEESKNLLRFKLLKAIPQHSWGLILGDVVHNVRSALDYIIWRLAGSDLADRTSMFPICLSEDDWKRAQWRFQKRPIHADALAYIRSLQPYTRPDPRRAILWLLQELDARDKHKLISMTRSVAQTARFRGTGELTVPYEAVEGALKDGTVLVEYPGPPQVRMDVEFKLGFTIMFERGVVSDTTDVAVPECVSKIFDAVEAIITNFETFLTVHPNWIPS